MVLFIVFAALLAVATVGLIAVPLIGPTRSGLAPASWTALLCAGMLVMGSALLYARFSNWSWTKSPGVNSPESMVESLVHRLNGHPDDLNGWLMLGRSYTVLQEYPLAVRAYARADRVAGGRSAEALVGQAEALTLSNDSQVTDRAGGLIERALAIDPSDAQALFFGAIVALHRGDLPLARMRFTRLLADNLPTNMKAVVEAQINTIDRELSPGPAAPSSRSASNSASAPTPSAALIRVNVRLSPALAGHARGTSPLYVFVRDAGQPGPPLAVKRLQSRFPQTVELTPADSMIPGHAFSAGERVEVIARIAPSGNPMEESGDLSGQTTYQVGRDGLVALVIDHLTR